MFSEYINSKYLSLRVNGGKGDGIELKKKYHIRGYPTSLFLKADGTEIDRIIGWDGDKEKYFTTIVDYTNGKNTVGELISKVQQSPDDVTLHYQLAKKHESRDENDLAQPYFEKVLELDPEDKAGFSTESRGYLALYHLYKTGEDQPLIQILDEPTAAPYLERGYNALLRYYSRKNQYDKASATYEKILNRFSRHADYMNRYAWFIYQNKIREKYKRGIELAQEAVKIRPEAANIWDTLAWLEYESGMKKEAIRHMEKAVALSANATNFKENLRIMRGKN